MREPGTHETATPPRRGAASIRCGMLVAALCALVNAQPPLTVDDALSIALKNNFDILVAQNDAAVARANNTPGNAGMLPTLTATGVETYSQSNTTQKPSSGAQIVYPDARVNAASAGIALAWTLFDGGKMFVTKQKLSEIEALGNMEYRGRVLQTAYDVIVGYYNVVRQKQELASINEVLAYNKDRVTILQTSFDAGLSPKTTYLQAQIDYNVNRENALSQESAIRDAKRALNLLLCRNPDTAFEVADSIPFTYVPDKARLAAQVYSGNVDIAAFEKQLEIARLTLAETRTLFFPKLFFSAGYSLSQSDNSAGSVAMSRGYGPQIGGTLTVPLYQAGSALRQAKTARIGYESARYLLDNEKQQVAAELSAALDEFESQRRLLEIEKGNDALAKENLDIAMLRLRLGEATSLELRQAQESYQDSRTRLITIEYNLKAAETKLKQLMAQM
jgi:outer membrane protein